MMLHYDPKTFVVSTVDARPAPPFATPPTSLARTLAGVAERLIAELRTRYTDLEIADEGRVRVNEAPGYGVGFRARRDGRWWCSAS